MFSSLLSALFISDEDSTETVVPNYGHGSQEDNVDLQLRSLIYCYRRLKIDKLTPFYPIDVPEDAENLGDGSVALDQVYNLEGFKRMLTEDPHRILVDWCKNKARLLCLLSETPVRRVNECPKDFSFYVLQPESPEEIYIQRLVHDSKLYREHDIPISWRTQCLQEILKKQLTLVPTRRNSFNKQDRWQIMIKYLSRLAEKVQIERVYNAYRSQSASGRRLSHSSDGSFERNESTTPTKTIRSKPSMTILRLDNSVRSRSSSQINSSYRNHPNSPAIVSRSPSPKKRTDTGVSTATHNNSPLYQQSKNCVMNRLEREKQRILNER